MSGSKPRLPPGDDSNMNPKSVVKANNNKTLIEEPELFSLNGNLQGTVVQCSKTFRRQG